MTTGRANPWLVLVLVCLAQFMVILDATIVNVALPSIQADLEMSDVRPPVGRQRVRADVRRVPAARRARGRPDRAQARVPRRARRSSRPRRCSCALATERDDADPRARAPGPRRRARLAGGPLDRHDDLRGGRGADEGARRLGGDRRRRRRGRPRRSAGCSSRRSRGRGSSSSTCPSGSPRSWSPCASCPSRRTSTRTRASTLRARWPSPAG